MISMPDMEGIDHRNVKNLSVECFQKKVIKLSTSDDVVATCIKIDPGGSLQHLSDRICISFEMTADWFYRNDF